MAFKVYLTGQSMQVRQHSAQRSHLLDVLFIWEYRRQKLQKPRYLLHQLCDPSAGLGISIENWPQCIGKSNRKVFFDVEVVEEKLATVFPTGDFLAHQFIAQSSE